MDILDFKIASKSAQTYQYTNISRTQFFQNLEYEKYVSEHGYQPIAMMEVTSDSEDNIKPLKSLVDEERQKLEKESPYFARHFRCSCCNRYLCDCAQNLATYKMIMANVKDMIDTIMDVLVICGMSRNIALKMWDAMYDIFLYFEDRPSLGVIHKKSIRKKDFFHKLACEYKVDRLSAQIGYSVMKRAFNAYYHCTDERGVTDFELMEHMKHTQQCQWVHAAKRTAYCISRYYGCFFSDMRKYELMIKCAYCKFHNRRIDRIKDIPLESCFCEDCFQTTIKTNNLMARENESVITRKENRLLERLKAKSVKLLGDNPSQQDGYSLNSTHTSRSLFAENPSHVVFNMPTSDHTGSKIILTTNNESSLGFTDVDQDTNSSSGNEDAEENAISFDFETISICNSSESISSCSCSQLYCLSKYDAILGVATAHCSQGPFHCTWLPTHANDTIKLQPPSHQLTPDRLSVDSTDSKHQSNSCDSECTCECSSCSCECDTVQSSVELPEQEISEAPYFELTKFTDRMPDPKYDDCRISAKYLSTGYYVNQQVTSSLSSQMEVNSTTSKPTDLLTKASNETVTDVEASMTTPIASQSSSTSENIVASSKSAVEQH